MLKTKIQKLENLTSGKIFDVTKDRSTAPIWLYSLNKMNTQQTHMRLLALRAIQKVLKEENEKQKVTPIRFFRKSA